MVLHLTMNNNAKIMLKYLQYTLGLTYRCVFRTGGNDVFKKRIPLDIQHVALVTTDFRVARVYSAILEKRNNK